MSPNIGPGRWHTTAEGPTQYLALHPLGPFAERLRGLGPAVSADLATLRWRTWAARVDLDALTVVDFDTAAAHGIDAAALVADDWGPCQALAGRLRADGRAGLVVPSAALAGTDNVVLFGPRLAAPYTPAPVDAALDVPTAHAAENSTVPAELVAHVRWPGQPHPGLQAWRAGHTYTFNDPPPGPAVGGGQPDDGAG